MTTPTKPTVFISYSHKDEVWKDRLNAHLGVLKEHGLLNFWDDREIGAGENWYDKIEDDMNEISRLLKRRDREGLVIRLFLGRLLSSSACLRFTNRRHSATMARRSATSISLLSLYHLISWSHFRGAPHWVDTPG